MARNESSETLMSDRRRDQLLKVAADCIGLMNVGVDGDVALSKLAADAEMNDHEVELVAHAVNNSKQLAHIQTSSDDDKEKPFALVDVDKVRNILQPTTNADVDTAGRYDEKAEMGDTTKDKQKAPDAVGISKAVLKNAHISYDEKDDYRVRKTAGDDVGALRDAWGLSSLDRRPTTPANPYAKLAKYEACIDEARTRAEAARRECVSLITKVAEAFQAINPPDFDRLEKAAALEGVSSDLMGLVRSAAGIETPAQPLSKTASITNFYVSDREYDLVQDCVRADTMLKTAASVVAAKNVLIGKKKALAADQAASAGEPPFIQPGLPADIQIKGDIGELSDDFSNAPERFGGLSSNRLYEAAGLGEHTATPISDVDEIISNEMRQELRASDIRSAIEDLMQDEYIGGHSLPEVVEAYNAAMSVNPKFGMAELISYMRQHLATQGAVPLDLQLRASSAYKRGN